MAEKIRIEMDGQFVTEIERNQYKIDAGPGSVINVIDNGPPTKLDVHGSARIAIENYRFHETSEDNGYLDLERSRSGTKADLSYDHITGQLKLENGAQVARLKKYKKLHQWKPDVPSENDCQQIPADQWNGAFGDKDFDQDNTMTCIKTVEADLGYLIVRAERDEKPIGYHIYSYVWVR